MATPEKTEPVTGAAPGASEVFVACRSNSARSQVAADLAAELAARRAGSVRPLDVVAAADLDPDGPGVVAIDGCSSACGARLLDAHGLTPVAAFTLDDVDVDRRPFADTVGVAATLVEQGSTARRARRPAPPAVGAAPGAHTVEDYLIAIDWLTSPVGPCGALVENAPTLAAHVSSTLGVSRPTAGEMLGRLEQQGLIRRGASKELVLTPAGRDRADRVVRAHRVLERFAVDTLGYGLDTCFAHARRLAPSFDGEAIVRLEQALGSPGRCPHGWPIDPAAARDAAAHLVALTALAPGVDAAVELLPESDLAALAQALEAGLTPGASVRRAEARVPGIVHLTADGSDRVLAADAAAAVLVRPA